MKALICITTCKRLLYLKYILPEYIDFVRNNPDFKFVVGLDGTEEDTIQFLRTNKVPFVYSKEREGVGLTKNRVLTQFPDIDYYFFIDDDVQLLNGQIFYDFISISIATGFHHMSSGEYKHFHGDTTIKEIAGYQFILSNWGSGVFNFFTKVGLNIVGGWHTKFAEIKRYGHTEHTYRYFHKNLAPRPYVVPEKYTYQYLRFRNPPSVTKNVKELLNPKSHYNIFEEELIMKKNPFFPLMTISEFYYESGDLDGIQPFDINSGIDFILKNNYLSEDEKILLLKEDYSLLMNCYDEYYMHSIDITKNKNYILDSRTFKIGKFITKIFGN